MDAVHARMTGLVSALSSGDASAAAATFDPAATISVREGHTVVVVMPAGQATRLITTAFADIGYIPVLRREAEGLLSDDGVLTGTHQAAFLGVPGDGRRVRLNVHLKAELRADGRLGDMDLETSVAALRHQLVGSGPPAAMADGMVAEVRERSNRAVSMLGRRGRDGPVAHCTPSTMVHRGDHRPCCSGGGGRDRGRSPSSLVASRAPSMPAPPRPPNGHHLGLDPAVILVTERATRHRTNPGANANAYPGPAVDSAGVCRSHRPCGTQVVLASDVLFGVRLGSAGPPGTGRIGGPGQPHHRRAPVREDPGQRLHRQSRLVGPWPVALPAAGSAVAQLLQGLLAGQPVTLAPRDFGEVDPSRTTRPRRVRPSTGASPSSFPPPAKPPKPLQPLTPKTPGPA